MRPEPARSIITRNDSPDIPFEQSINPYRGCEHGCIYCLTGDTPILMADGSSRPLAQVRTGDSHLRHDPRRLVPSIRQDAGASPLERHQACVPTHAARMARCWWPAADHRFLTERGWKYLTGTQCGADRRPHLTTGNKLMGTGAFATPPEHDQDYRRRLPLRTHPGRRATGRVFIFASGRVRDVSVPHSDWPSVIRRRWSAPGSGCGARASRPSASNSALARRTAGRCRRSVHTHACRWTGFAS